MITIENRESLALQLLKALPEETDIRKFEQKAKEMIMSMATRDLIREMEDLLALPETDIDDRIAYNAFAALGTYYRHMKDTGKLEELFESYGARFNKESHPSFQHFDLLRYIDRDLKSDWLTIFQRAQDNCASGSAGSRHLFADLVVYHFEHHDETDLETREKWLSQAEDELSKARAKEDYPKFRCTQGRLLALLGLFDDAERLIHSAIDMEPSSAADYVLRIGNYQYHLLMVQERRQIARLKSEMDQYIRSIDLEHQKIEDSLIKNIEYLGLFAGIVSFVIGSLSLAGSLTSESIPGVAGLIMVLFGALLGVFSGFTFMLHDLQEKRWAAPVVVFLVSVLILLGGLKLCFNV